MRVVLSDSEEFCFCHMQENDYHGNRHPSNQDVASALFPREHLRCGQETATILLRQF